MNIPQYIITMVALVIMSAYFSATETAFSSFNKTRIKTLAEKGSKKAKLALKLSDEYDKLISTILIGNNIVNIALASIATVMFVSIYPDNGATVSTAVVTIAVLIFGEISPKSIAKDCPEKFVMFSAPIISAFMWLLTPLNFVFTQWKKLLSKIFNIKSDSKMSQEELLMLVEEVQQDGSIDDEEGDLIRNVIEFSEIIAEDILTHRVDVEAVSIDADKANVARKLHKTQFSRLPVYEEIIDNVVGIVHIKDFFSEEGITDKEIKDIMAKPLFIQKYENVDDILKIFKKNKSHIAVVIDEYGGTLGIVTMEDILEELVGEIWDEHDEVIEDIKEITQNIFMVDGSANFDDFCEFFELETEEEAESVSVGGWVSERLEKIPEKGEKFEYQNLTIEVVKTESHRVLKVKVLRNQKKDD